MEPGPMLLTLSIRNFAIIEASDIEFGPGFNVITGETGAGKSILIDALGAVLGERTSSDLVRTGNRMATVDATFDIEGIVNREDLNALLAELEIEAEEGLLILGREIQASGRSLARLNGRPTTATTLSRIGALLVDIHGQSDHLSLLRPSTQLDLLDRYARTLPLRERVANDVREWTRIRRAIQSVQSGARERMQRIDLLRFQIDEIRSAAIEVSEEAELESERSRLVHAEQLKQDAYLAVAALAGDDEVSDAPQALGSLRIAVSAMQDGASLDPSMADLVERLNDLLFTMEDVASTLRDYRDALEINPERLHDVEERLDLLRQLKRKYGAELSDVLAFVDEAERELASLTGGEADVAELSARAAELSESVAAQALALSNARQQAALAMAEQVERVISDLRMGSAGFQVELARSVDGSMSGLEICDRDGSRVVVDATGIDRVTFMFAPNQGEGFKPLSRIASGGETARLTLALKSVLSDVDETPTLIFDEIDVGVGGRAGQPVGEKLANLATTHQVITITHLPQIAAVADTHFRIFKQEHSGRVVSTIGQLDEEARIEEIAAMIDGIPISQSALDAAREMVQRVSTGV
jgi:DNA repair protein RecN (Recombination protein N)